MKSVFTTVIKVSKQEGRKGVTSNIMHLSKAIIVDDSLEL